MTPQGCALLDPGIGGAVGLSQPTRHVPEPFGNVAGCNEKG